MTSFVCPLCGDMAIVRTRSPKADLLCANDECLLSEIPVPASVWFDPAGQSLIRMLTLTAHERIKDLEKRIEKLEART